MDGAPCSRFPSWLHLCSTLAGNCIHAPIWNLTGSAYSRNVPLSPTSPFASHHPAIYHHHQSPISPRSMPTLHQLQHTTAFLPIHSGLTLCPPSRPVSLGAWRLLPQSLRRARRDGGLLIASEARPPRLFMPPFAAFLPFSSSVHTLTLASPPSLRHALRCACRVAGLPTQNQLPYNLDRVAPIHLVSRFRLG